MSSHPRLCIHGNWSDIYNGPTSGVLKFSADNPVGVNWRAYFGPFVPPYTAGHEFVSGSKDVVIGLPAPWVHVEVNPDETATLQVN